MNKQEIIGAVERTRSELKVDLDRFQLYLHPQRVRPSFGGWLVPAELHASSAVRKSYELHKLIERIEERLYELTKSTVSVDLNPAA